MRVTSSLVLSLSSVLPASVLLASVLWASISGATAPQEPYRLPPPEVVEILDAQPAPSVQLSPDGQWMFLVQRESMPSIEDVSRRMLRLAGTRIDPAADARFSTSFSTSVSLRATTSPDETPKVVALPDGAKVSSVSWSHDSTHFVVTLVTDHGSELWGGTTADPGAVRRLSDRLNTVLSGPSWMPDGASVLCRLVPEDRGDEPAPPRAPKGPNVQMTTGEATPLRTYQDLLGNPYDGALFEYYASAELAVVSVEDGSTRSLGTGMHMQARVSPDGKFLLETLIQRPFSFVMPYYQFPHRVQVRALDAEQATVQATVLADVPLDSNIPIGGVRTGPRSFTWKASEPATVMWTEALDGGDPKVEVPHRDRWLSLGAPFDVAQASEVLRIEHRAQGLSFLADPNLLITREYDRDLRWSRSLLHDLSGSDAPKVLEDRSRNDRYGDPGRLLSHPGPFGVSVVRRDGDFLYRAGRGASPEGDLPFLDRQNIATLATERVWRCELGSYESVVQVMEPVPDQALVFITRHESPETPSNLRLRSTASDDSIALTAFPDPTPQLRGITKRLVRYERSDGVPLSATLYLPAGYQEGTRLPLVVWAYPREFNDVRTAGMVSGSPSRFTRISGPSHLFYLTQGYAVMDGATIPIIGDAETMNDTFREQLVASAKAAIDFAVAEGVADPARVGVGGHSYGAFMTANLLAHSDLFSAGVARSGAYNRTLTPFGFQSERRTLWDSPETYFAISPFMHAHKIEAPMLMIHGEADNNSGTFPLQSRRMFQAIQGNGGTARLVMLPNESHGYRARESVLHTLAEMIEWFEIYVKGGETTLDAGYSSGK